MDSGQSFGSWLGQQIKRREFSQREFARKAGVPPSSLSEWVRGASTPEPESCRKIAGALGIAPKIVLDAAGYGDEDEPVIEDDPRELLAQRVRRMKPDPGHIRLINTILDNYDAEARAEREARKKNG